MVDGDPRSVGENGDGGRVGRPGGPLPNFRRVYDPGNGGGGGGKDTTGVVFVVDGTISIEVQWFQDRRRYLGLSRSLAGSISRR